MIFHLLRKVIEENVMDLDIAGRRAFVSGSTQGIGYASARAPAATSS